MSKVDLLVSYSQASGALIFITFLSGAQLLTWLIEDGIDFVLEGGLPMGILFISTLAVTLAVRSMVNNTKKKLEVKIDG